jgi:DNA-binding GntR family transcriptional regulator
MSDKAFEALYGAIVRCQLPPGMWLKASEVSELLGVGRTPTIQALQRLEAAGFTRPVKRKGWQVAPLTLQSVHDIFEAFRLTAPGLAMLIVRNASDEQIDTLRELMLAWTPGGTASESEPNFNIEPVRYFIEICGNNVMTEMARGMAAHFERVINFGLRQGRFVDAAYYRWSTATIDAIAARDERRARDSTFKLIEASESEINRILQAAHSIRSIPIQLDRVS